MSSVKLLVTLNVKFWKILILCLALYKDVDSIKRKAIAWIGMISVADSGGPGTWDSLEAPDYIPRPKLHLLTLKWTFFQTFKPQFTQCIYIFKWPILAKKLEKSLSHTLLSIVSNLYIITGVPSKCIFCTHKNVKVMQVNLMRS